MNDFSCVVYSAANGWQCTIITPNKADFDADLDCVLQHVEEQHGVVLQPSPSNPYCWTDNGGDVRVCLTLIAKSH